LRGTW